MAAEKYFQTVVVNKLKEGIIPWHRPWTPGYSGAISRATGKPYSAINQWLLNHTGEYIGIGAAKAEKVDFTGVRTEKVTWASPMEIPVKDSDGNPKTDEEGNPVTRTIFVYGVHPVLPVCLCRGVKPRHRPDMPGNPFVGKSDCIDGLMGRYMQAAGVTLMETDGTGDPCYVSEERTVRINPVYRYESQEAYYNDLFRVLVRSYFDRGCEKVGTRGEMKDELMAEMGASMLCHTFGLDTEKVFDNSVAYIQKWIGRISADERMVLQAASLAEKAVNGILGLTEKKS